MGRFAAGLSINDHSFATLPPHFVTDGAIFTEEEWKTYIPGWKQYPDCFKSAIPFLIASVVYHIDWLEANLPQSHSFFQSPFYCDNVIGSKNMKEKVECGEFSCEKTKMQATGIPPTINVLRELAVVKDTMQKNDSAINDRVTTLLNEVDGVSKQVDGLNSTLPAELTKELLKKFEVNGAVPLTENNLVGLEQRLTDTLRTLIEESLSSRGGSGTTAAASAVPPPPPGLPSASQQRAHWFQWRDGTFKRVPEGFTFPRCSSKSIWGAWWHGQPVNGIGPFHHFTSKDVSKERGQNAMSKARGVIDAVVKWRWK